MKKHFKYFSIPLLLILIASSFSTALIHISFNVNQAYIIRELCQNRDKPQMHCNGKCYLKKRLKENDDRRNENKNSTVNTEHITWLNCRFMDFKHFPSPAQEIYPFTTTEVKQGFRSGIDHPPAFVS